MKLTFKFYLIRKSEGSRLEFRDELFTEIGNFAHCFRNHAVFPDDTSSAIGISFGADYPAGTVGIYSGKTAQSVLKVMLKRVIDDVCDCSDEQNEEGCDYGFDSVIPHVNVRIRDNEY